MWDFCFLEAHYLVICITLMSLFKMHFLRASLALKSGHRWLEDYLPINGDE